MTTSISICAKKCHHFDYFARNFEKIEFLPKKMAITFFSEISREVFDQDICFAVDGQQETTSTVDR